MKRLSMLALAVAVLALSGCTLGPRTEVKYFSITSLEPVTALESKKVRAAKVRYDENGNVITTENVDVGVIDTQGKVIMDGEHFSSLRKWAQKGYAAESAKNGGK